MGILLKYDCAQGLYRMKTSLLQKPILGKETIKMKRQSTEWEKIFTHIYLCISVCVCNKDLTFKIYKELNSRKANDPIKNERKNLNRHSLRRHTNDQQGHENMVNATNHLENRNQVHNDISPHIC